MEWFTTALPKWAVIGKRAFGAFLDSKQEDSSVRTASLIGGAVMRRLVFLKLDYLLTALTAAVAVALHEWHPFDGWVQVLFIFVALWLLELACAIPFIVAWRKTGIDMTLAADARRAIDQVSFDSKLAGRVGYIFFILKGILWDGPEEVIIFFYDELKAKKLIFVTLLVVSAIQAALWGFVFIWMYEIISWLTLTCCST